MTKSPKRSTGPAEGPVQGSETTSVIPIEHVQSKILLIRGRKVILDADLAKLYGVQTRVLGQAVKRNIERFPPDFMFQLTKEEFDLLRSQTVISNERPGRGGRRSLPYAFTEHGAIMAASVLNSERAVQASVFVVRAFVRLKQMLTPYKELMAKLDRLENKVRDHDEDIVAIVEAIRLLMPRPTSPKNPSASAEGRGIERLRPAAASGDGPRATGDGFFTTKGANDPEGHTKKSEIRRTGDEM